jgi:hypothetical protein
MAQKELGCEIQDDPAEKIHKAKDTRSASSPPTPQAIQSPKRAFLSLHLSLHSNSALSFLYLPPTSCLTTRVQGCLGRFRSSARMHAHAGDWPIYPCILVSPHRKP